MKVRVRVRPAHHLEHGHDARGGVVAVEEDGAVVGEVQPALPHLDALTVHGAIVEAGLDPRAQHALVDALVRVRIA